MLQLIGWALNARPRGLGFLWGHGSQAGAGAWGAAQPGPCVTDFLRKHLQWGFGVGGAQTGGESHGGGEGGGGGWDK